MATSITEAHAPSSDGANRVSLLRRMVDRFRAARSAAQMARINPRLREDAGLGQGIEIGWPRLPMG